MDNPHGLCFCCHALSPCRLLDATAISMNSCWRVPTNPSTFAVIQSEMLVITANLNGRAPGRLLRHSPSNVSPDDCGHHWLTEGCCEIYRQAIIVGIVYFYYSSKLSVAGGCSPPSMRSGVSGYLPTAALVFQPTAGRSVHP